MLVYLAFAVASRSRLLRYSNLQQIPFTRNFPKNKAYGCENVGSTFLSKLDIDSDCNSFSVIDCQFSNNKGIKLISSPSKIGGKMKLLIKTTSFVKCSTNGKLSENAACYFNTRDSWFEVIDNNNIIESCSFNGCGQGIYAIFEINQKAFPMSHISITDIRKNTDSGSFPETEQCGIHHQIKSMFTSYPITNVNFTNSREIFTIFGFFGGNVELSFININNISTMRLIQNDIYQSKVNCININAIYFYLGIFPANDQVQIFYSDSNFDISNAIITNLVVHNEQVAYLVYQKTYYASSFTNCYSTLNKNYGSVSGTITLIKELYKYIFDSYGCSIELRPTSLFSRSEQFSPSSKFSKSNVFSNSKFFSKSHSFSKSMWFSKSKQFTSSIIFSRSNIFSKSNKFTESVEFTRSKQFSSSHVFTRSSFFSSSEIFTGSNYLPSSSFTPSNIFTPSDSKYVYFVRLSKEAALPTKTSQFGPLSATAMATVSVSVIVAICVTGGILMIFYLNEQKKNLIEQEYSDLLELPSNSSDSTEECVISFSYSLHTISHEEDQFNMDPDLYFFF